MKIFLPKRYIIDQARFMGDLREQREMENNNVGERRWCMGGAEIKY